MREDSSIRIVYTGMFDQVEDWIKDENGDYYRGKRDRKTKQTNPYDYDPILQYEDPRFTATNTVWSDRMLQWDSNKFNNLCKKHFGNNGQCFYDYDRDHVSIEKFLRDYFNKPNLVIVKIEEWCNVATGFPVWFFSYADNTFKYTVLRMWAVEYVKNNWGVRKRLPRITMKMKEIYGDDGR